MQSGDSLKLVTICAYLTDVATAWRQDDYTASKMVKALKGQPINGYFETKIANTTKRFDQANAQEFVERIPRAMEAAIARHIKGPATLIPIPNSHVISADTPNFKTLELAEAIARHSAGKYSVCPALVFKTAQQKSHEGGPRDPVHFLNAYKLTADVIGEIVLIDDVATTCAHFKGAIWKLASKDRMISLAAAFGRSTKVQIPSPIGIYEETIDIRKPPATLAERVKRLLEAKKV